MIALAVPLARAYTGMVRFLYGTNIALAVIGAATQVSVGDTGRALAAAAYAVTTAALWTVHATLAAVMAGGRHAARPGPLLARRPR